MAATFVTSFTQVEALAIEKFPVQLRAVPLTLQFSSVHTSYEVTGIPGSVLGLSHDMLKVLDRQLMTTSLISGASSFPIEVEQNSLDYPACSILQKPI